MNQDFLFMASKLYDKLSEYKFYGILELCWKWELMWLLKLVKKEAIGSLQIILI